MSEKIFYLFYSCFCCSLITIIFQQQKIIKDITNKLISRNTTDYLKITNNIKPEAEQIEKKIKAGAIIG